MLEVRQLSVSYGRHRALENASIRVGRGEIVVILGANGAGKSSLLKAIGGISEGRVDGSVGLGGVDLSAMKPDRIVEAGIALVPEGRGVFADLNVAENLSLGAYGQRARDEESANIERVYELFPRLRERRRQVVRTMSGGEQQMVAIGRAMMSNPEILMLDEPSLGLSPILCKDLFQRLGMVRNSGIGILLVEQNAKQSLAIADRGYVLENGTIVMEAPADVLMNDPAVRKAYLGVAGAKLSVAERQQGQKTHPAAAPVSAVASANAPKPGLPGSASPMDIAAAAMTQYLPRSAEPYAPGQKPAPPSKAAQSPLREMPVPTVRWSEPQLSAAVPNGAAPPVNTHHGIDIAGLVAGANTRSAQGVSMPASRNAIGSRGGSSLPPREAVAAKSVAIPDLKPGQDRLGTVLAEIEAAAAKAKNYRPPGRKS